MKKGIMMKFIYDSLETVKKLKHPTKKDFINLTIAIFAAITIAGVYFILADTVFSGLYKRFYSIMQ
ncbi:MAG: preprotein translocase subunit SecE [bacterium]